jgi:PmbA protein
MNGSSADAGVPAADTLFPLMEDALREARALGASAAEVGASLEAGLEVAVRMGEVETLEHHRDRALGVTLYFGTRKGSASTTDFSPRSLAETVRAAAHIARHTAEDDCAGLADAALLARDIPDLDLFHPWAIGPDQAIAQATECESAARGLDARITNSEGASLSTHSGLRAYANSDGFCAGYRSSRHSLSCAVIGQDGEGMQRDYWYSVSRDAGALEAPASVGRHAAERTLARLNPRRLSTRKAPVLFDANVAGSLIGHLLSAVRGGSLYRKASFLLDHLGKPVFPAFVRLHEAPHLRGALGSAPFDHEGVATRARDLVAGGVLQGYVLDSYSARKLGMQTTGNAGGVHNLTVEPGAEGLDALLKRMGTGLLVTELLGHGVNTVTGDYSRGAAGFWVESGVPAYAVDEVTVAGNLRGMFMNLVAAGKDLDLRGNIRCGSLLISEMTIAGE